jgi:hypothetical protein
MILQKEYSARHGTILPSGMSIKVITGDNSITTKAIAEK